MKTICIMNLKGGVGKTVTAINLAAIFALLHGKRVLLIDADHQGNTSKFYKADQDGTTLREVLAGEAEPCWSGSVQRTEYPGLDILPANMSLAELDAAPGLADSGAVWRLLKRVAEDCAYDYAVIDMPPAFSLSARAALAAADEVIVPIKLDAFSIDGMAELLRQIASMRRINPGLTLAGLLITMWHNVNEVTQPEAILRGGQVPVFKTVIRRSDVVDGMTHEKRPVSPFRPTPTTSPRASSSTAAPRALASTSTAFGRPATPAPPQRWTSPTCSWTRPGRFPGAAGWTWRSGPTAWPMSASTWLSRALYSPGETIQSEFST